MATFNFNCPQCGNLLSGEDEWRGMESECPYCKKNITIPLAFRKTPLPKPQKSAKAKVILTNLPWKQIIIFTILVLSITIYLTQCSSEAQHRKRVKNLNGFVVLNKAALASPSSKINFDYYEKYKLISYSPASRAYTKGYTSVSVYPRLDFSIEENKYLLRIYFSAPTLDKKCTVKFISGVKREFEIKSIKSHPYIPSQFIDMTPEEYYIYFILDTPERIDTKAFSKYGFLQDYTLAGKPEDFKCFKDFEELFILQKHSAEYSFPHDFCNSQLKIYGRELARFAKDHNGKFPDNLQQLREMEYCSNTAFCPVSGKMYRYRLAGRKDIKSIILPPDEITIFCPGCKTGLRGDGMPSSQPLHPGSMNAPVRKIQDDRVFITAKLRNTANQEFIPLMEAVSLAPQSKDSLEKLNNFQHYIRQIQKLEQDIKFYESVPNINDYAKYLDAQNKLRNAKFQILNIKAEALKIHIAHSRDNLQMIMFDVQNKRPQRVYGVNGFNKGQALLNNVKPGKYIVSAAGTIQNIRFTWIFVTEKIEGKPLYLNLTNNQDCLINE
ncbi:MAG: hypothetical protein J6C40_09225 [Lentisphaeria bacterium]|nr:hypothetical protein [Lentisphaeria bacterium]